MKIVLIAATSARYARVAAEGRPYRYYAPTTLIHLASLVPAELGPKITIFDQGIEAVPDNLEADLIGISATTCAAKEAYALADHVRSRGIIVVIGGYHASAVPHEALHHADSVVIGYAEHSWPQLLRDFKNKRLKKIYRQSTKDELLSMPRLNRSLHRGKKYIISDTLEATRGCSNHCEFCVIPPFISNGIITRPVEDIIRDMQGMGKNILFLDSNMVANREYQMKLWEELVPLNKRWFGGATLDLADDNELLALAVKSGCAGVLIGFESINQRSLDLTNKGFNRVAAYTEKIKKLHDNGISILGAFIFGFDGDDASVFEKTVDFMNENKISAAKYAILTPFPGTPLFKKMQRTQRISSTDWGLYDGEHCVFKPQLMSPELLEQGLLWAHKNTYSLRSIVHRLPFDRTLHLTLPINLAFRLMRS